MNNISETDAWGDITHAEVFDYLANIPNRYVKKFYESFNETKRLNKYINQIKGNKFFEIGCATGELYRYIINYIPKLEYYGFDISEPAIRRAKEKYPQGRFELINSEINDLVFEYGQPDIVWCRDVLMHQKSPYILLRDIINMTKSAVVLRLRTRDVGATIHDSDLSCQLHWDKYWVPYIVLNIEEMINKIQEHQDVSNIIISRRYEVLGGHNFRYLPKELYSKNSGTAETPVLIMKGKKTNSCVELLFIDSQDGQPYSTINRVVLKIISIIKKRKIK